MLYSTYPFALIHLQTHLTAAKYTAKTLKYRERHTEPQRINIVCHNVEQHQQQQKQHQQQQHRPNYGIDFWIVRHDKLCIVHVSPIKRQDADDDVDDDDASCARILPLYWCAALLPVLFSLTLTLCARHHKNTRKRCLHFMASSFTI